MRKTLRSRHGFPRDLKRRFGVPCIFSPEPVRLPESDASCATGANTSLRLDCANGFGTNGAVTAAFGMAAAAHIIKSIALGENKPI
jgi:tRNA A37 threonylcarbamoyladenosine dehydratase